MITRVKERDVAVSHLEYGRDYSKFLSAKRLETTMTHSVKWTVRVGGTARF